MSKNLHLVVAKIDLQYLKPAFLGDLLRVETRLKDAKGVRLVVEHKIWRSAECVFTANILLVCVDQNFRPKPLPKDFLAEEILNRKAL